MFCGNKPDHGEYLRIELEVLEDEVAEAVKEESAKTKEKHEIRKKQRKHQ